MANQTLQLATLLTAEGVNVEVVRTNAPYRPAWIGKMTAVRAVARLFFYLVQLWKIAGHVQVFHVMANSGWSWHLFAAPVLVIGRLRRVPVVINYRGGGAEEFFDKSFFWVNLSLRYATTVVVPSGFLERVFLKYKIQPKIVPNIINLDKFKNVGPKAEGDLVIFTARNLEEIYGIDVLLQAFQRVYAQCPQAKLIIAGDGPERQTLTKQAEALGIADATSFTGRLDNDDIVRYYAAATIAVNPSRVDNMPISILEALACEIPVVSTSVGGVPYMVENEKTALLVEPDAPERMADAILRLVNDAALRTQLTTAGRKEIESYTWPVIKKAWFDVYASIVR